MKLWFDGTNIEEVVAFFDYYEPEFVTSTLDLVSTNPRKYKLGVEYNSESELDFVLVLPDDYVLYDPRRKQFYAVPSYLVEPI